MRRPRGSPSPSNRSPWPSPGSTSIARPPRRSEPSSRSTRSPCATSCRAPCAARVGLSDVHPGQYLNEGTELTTLQGVDAAVNVDFTVAQAVAAELHPGDPVAVFGADDARPLTARIVAVDAKIDPATRNALVRARIPSH